MRVEGSGPGGCRSGSWRFAPAALALGVAIALTASSSQGTANGQALAPGSTHIDGLAPGDQIGALFVDLENRSASPLRLDSVSFTGQGVGTVVRVVEVKIARTLTATSPCPEARTGPIPRSAGGHQPQAAAGNCWCS
jgi:hypothetical protein